MGWCQLTTTSNQNMGTNRYCRPSDLWVIRVPPIVCSAIVLSIYLRSLTEVSNPTSPMLSAPWAPSCTLGSSPSYAPAAQRQLFQIACCNSYPFGYFQTWSMPKKLMFSLPIAFRLCINGFCSEFGEYHLSFCRLHTLDPAPSTGIHKSSKSITTDYVSWEIPALEHAKCWKSRAQSWPWFLGGVGMFGRGIEMEDGWTLGSKWHIFSKIISLD